MPNPDPAQVEWANLSLEWIKLAVGVGTTLVTAWWILHTWRKQRQTELTKLDEERERTRNQRERDLQQRADEHRRARERHAALYVSPFMLACEEVQSRIWNILCNQGLKALRQRYPNGGYEKETVYLIVQYFGWERLMYRYGPYTHDATMIQLTQAIRQVLAADPPPGSSGAFWFVRTEQRALAQFVMRRAQGEFGVEFESLPFYRFDRLLSRSPLATSPTISESHKALRDASDDAGNLIGRKRLADVQHHLVKLLEYLESRERVTLAPHARQDA